MTSSPQNGSNNSVFKLFTYTFTKDALSRRTDSRDLTGAGITQPDAIPSMGPDGSSWGGNDQRLVHYRESNDMIDLSTVSNRQNRYKEYERLRNVPEIEMTMTVYADEACVGGNTKVATPFGFQTIETLAKTKKPDEKFLVYCYDFAKEDYTLGWAFAPRLVKKDNTVRICLDDGSEFVATADHRVLLRNEEWMHAGDLSFGSELMPFYRLKANPAASGSKVKQFPRIWTHAKGWVHERQFVDEWRLGKETERANEVGKTMRLIASGLPFNKICDIMNLDWKTIKSRMGNEGFSFNEAKMLSRYRDRRRVVGVHKYNEMDVYDLSVEKHKNFCTDCVVLHNCQKDENGNIFRIDCNNQEVKQELEFLFYHRMMLNMNRRSWADFKLLCMTGDLFYEIVINPDNPSDGVLKIQKLPPESIYRIQTTKDKVIEFQQSREGPDYNSLIRAPVVQSTDAEVMQATALRFTPDQVIHIRIGDDRKTFFPYGVSLIEPARGPAHQLRLMEDSMVVYRLTRAPERRVFYIDVGQLPPFKAEAFIERMKDQFRKRKVATSRSPFQGAGQVEERWQAPAADEDYWLPVRPNSQTKIDTLPGACLALDTEIPLLDGRTLKLSEIIEEHKAGKTLWTYSCCPKTGKFAPGLISWAGITRKNTEVVRVTFDNGESIVCTPDHKFPVQGKGKIEAKDLRPGYSMFPFTVRLHELRPQRPTKYLQIYDIWLKEWSFVHRMVKKYLKGTDLDKTLVYDQRFADCDKRVIHHENFNRFDNTPGNLVWMNWDDHKLLHNENREQMNAHISEALQAYHRNMPDDKKKERDSKLAVLSPKGVQAISKKLKDASFNQEFRRKQREGWEKSLDASPELHKERGQKIAERNKTFWSCKDKKTQAFAKQTIIYPDSIFDALCAHLRLGLSLNDALTAINSDSALLDLFIKANSHIIRNVDLAAGLSVIHAGKMVKNRTGNTIKKLRESLGGKKSFLADRQLGRPRKIWPPVVLNKVMTLLASGCSVDKILSEVNASTECETAVAEAGFVFMKGFDRNSLNKLLKQAGYKGIQDAKAKAKYFNHKVVSVEFLPEKVDTGTLTIDADHLLHDYHTFAVSRCGIYTYNSNLGEIDDAVYFRNKLFTALNFPKNYFNNEDPNATRITLSAQDVKFARMIERLQSYFEDGMWEVADRHLRLRGYPEETYEDLKIKMTPPSEWRELSRAEVVTNRLSNASNLKSSLLMADYDILTKWMKFTDAEAQQVIARMKIQKLEDLKLQILAQNPQLLGIGIPGQQTEPNEIGTEPGGPSPNLAPPGGPPPGGDPGVAPGGPPPGLEQMATNMSNDEKKPGVEGGTMPEPDDEDIVKFDLEIQDYASEQDNDNIDYSEEDM